MGLSRKGPRSSCEELFPVNARCQPKQDIRSATAQLSTNQKSGGKETFAASRTEVGFADL